MPFCGDGGAVDDPMPANCVWATGIVPVFVNAAEVLMLLNRLLLKFVAAVVSAVVGDCAFCLDD